MSTFRTLHTYTVTLQREVEETTTREEGGKKITETLKVKKDVPYTITLKEPSRSEKNELALFKDITYGYAIDKGLVTKAKMQQKLGQNDSANPLSEDEDKVLNTLTLRLHELETQFMELRDKPSAEANPEDVKERREKVLQEYLIARRKVDEMNAAYQSIYASTAENYTQTKMLTWLTLYLTYVTDPVEGAQPRAMFPGSDYPTKEAKLNDLEDSRDELYLKVIEKLPSYWAMYLFNRANSTEQFKVIEEEWNKEEKMKQELEPNSIKKTETKEPPKDEPPQEPPAPVLV